MCSCGAYSNIWSSFRRRRSGFLLETQAGKSSLININSLLIYTWDLEYMGKVETSFGSTEKQMNILIVENNPNLGALWANHLCRLSLDVTLASDQDSAVELLQENDWGLIILNLVLENGSAFAVADYAAYKAPDTKVLFVTNTSFFSDGSIFEHIPNACGLLQSGTPPQDLAAIAEHHATHK
jgi:CheY-like chemotaxis protein